jgi:tetratricopeptide (TPR) repeat protein
MSPRVLGVVLACVACLVPRAEAARRSKEPATLADLSQRSAPLRPEEPVVADIGLAARSYEDFLRIAETDPALRAQALRRLGDLRLAEAEELRAQDGAMGERAAGLTKQAIAAYDKLLAEQPMGRGTDVALYQLSRAHESLGESDRALARLDALVAGHPDSAHYAEAQFRRGEVFFSAQRYADAQRAYQAVLAPGAGAEFRQQARYKLGWSYFKQSLDDQSNATFLVLLDELLVADGKLRPTDSLSRAEQELTDDALRALAITFAAAEGPPSLQSALERHGLAPYEAQVYRALGDLFVEKERYQDAAESYRAYAKRRPLDPDAALLLVRATEAYEKGGFASLVLDGKRELVENYGPRSEFWAAYTPNIVPAVSAAVQSTLLDLARHHHALAQQSNSAAERGAAIRWYRDYLEGFDATPEAAATRLLLADLLFEGASYDEAATEYERAAYGYALGPQSGRAGYAALVAFEKAEAAAPAAARAGLRQRATESSLRFADTFPEAAEVPAVLTRATRVLFDAGDRERAEAVAQRVLALGARADASQQRVAWTVLAHTYFDSERYAEAEQAYAELARRVTTDDPERAEIVERLAASVYRQAEARRASGDNPGAVRDFLRVAQVAPASPIRAAAEFDAATLLLTGAAWAEAASILEAFRREHPGHSLQPEVTRKLAVAYLEGGRPQLAAVELERIAATETEEPAVRRSALWQAADLYSAAEDVPAARRAYEAYVRWFPSPFDAATEARHELARLASAAGDHQARQKWLGEIVMADAAAGAERTDRSRLLAAQASLELARPLDDAARAVKLVVPLDRSMLAKKSALESALTAYGRAAEYGVASVATEATYAMAELYRHLGRALLDSERPRDLSAEELEQYELLLEEQAFPFEEKAIGIHERNARRAAEGLYDESVQRSFAALAEIKPGRYARVERDAGRPAAQIDLPEVEAALVAEPSRADLLNRLGIAQRRIGRFADARVAYEQAVAADPLLPDPELNLAVLLDLYLDDPATALVHYERFQALNTAPDRDVDSWLVELRARLGKVQRTAEISP